jgi:hypothetical protein
MDANLAPEYGQTPAVGNLLGPAMFGGGADPAAGDFGPPMFDFTPNEMREIEIEEMLTKQKLREQEVKEYKDTASAKLIMEAAQASQARLAKLEGQLMQTQAMFEQEAPVQDPRPQMAPETLWSSAIGGLITGNWGEAANWAQQTTQQEAKVAFENAMRKYGLDQRQAERMWQQVSQQIAREQQMATGLAQEGIRGAQEFDRGQEQSRQFDASNKLAGEREERLDVRMRVQEFNKVMSYWQTAGEISEADRQIFEESRRQMIAEGVPSAMLMPVPSGKTAKYADQLADNSRQDADQSHRHYLDWAKFDQHAEEFDAQFKQKESQFLANQNATRRKFDEEVRQFNLKNQQGHYAKSPRAAKTDSDKALAKAEGSIANVQNKIAGVEAQLKEARGKLAGLGPMDAGRFELQGKINTLEVQHAGLVGMLDNWFENKRKLLPPIETVRAQARQLIERGAIDEAKFRAKFKKDYGVEF